MTHSSVTYRDEEMRGRVRIALPADPRLLKVVRHLMQDVAEHIDAARTDIQDLVLGAEELCLRVLSSATSRSDEIDVELQWAGCEINLRCTLRVAPKTLRTGEHLEFNQHRLSAKILDGTADIHGVSSPKEAPHAWLQKHYQRR